MNELELPVGISTNEAKGIDVSESRRITVKDEDVANYFQEAFRVADEMRMPRKNVWDVCWDLYNGDYDWSAKAGWQAQINIPKVRGTVDKATATFRRALTRMKRFYQIESETKLGIEKGFFTMNLMDYWLDQINFPNEFTTGLKNGLITSTVIFKVWWNWVSLTEPHWVQKTKKEALMELGIKIGEVEVPYEEISSDPMVKGMLGLKAVSSYNFWIGPRDSYKIERTHVDMAYLYYLVDKGIYNREAVDKLASESTMSIDKQTEARRKGERADSPSKYIKDVELWHYWGDLYDEDGKIVEKNITFTVAGKSKDIVIRKPTRNPLLHGTDPYIVGTPYVVPFSTYNRGIVEDIAGIAKMITELSCLIIDGAQFDALQAYEADVDLLDDPRQLKRGIYPGATFATKGFENPTNKNVIRNVSTGQIPQLALNVLGMLNREQQLSSNVTDAQKGGSIPGVETLGEFQSIIGGANEALDDAARTIEETVLNKLLEKTAKTIYQYHEDYELPRLSENFPQTSTILTGMPALERYATMVGGFQFRARGVSIFLDKQQDLEKAMRFLEMISNIPGVLTRVNIDDLLEQIIIALGWNPQKLLINPASQPVMPQGMMGGQPVQQPGAFPGPQDLQQLTPAQIMAGQAGAREGGATNNPMAGFGMGGQ